MKTLLITGGSAGIGASTAHLFADAGFRVINLSRRPCPVAQALHLSCNLADPDFIDTIDAPLRRELEQAETLVLVHNAARMENDRAVDTSARAMQDVLAVNVVAPTALNQLCFPYMKPGSAILYVGSTLSEKAVPGSYSYVTSKHAMVGMMRATCQDLAGSGVHTVCVCPGFTDTEMLRQHVPVDALVAVQAISAFNRLIDPTEIAETLLFAATHPVLNGAVVHANLGQVER
ncbi:MAG: SDR family oxidoreductase [Pseudomonadales bacterium]